MTLPAEAQVRGWLALITLAAAPAFGADLERGRALYENHCRGCHTSQVHGRAQRTATDAAQLGAVVARWQAQQNLHWSREETGDVVYFLRVTQYNY